MDQLSVLFVFSDIEEKKLYIAISLFSLLSSPPPFSSLPYPLSLPSILLLKTVYLFSINLMLNRWINYHPHLVFIYLAPSIDRSSLCLPW